MAGTVAGARAGTLAGVREDVPRRFCASCGQWSSRRFRLGPGARPDARCPSCTSLERQRFLAVLTSCLRPLVEPGTLLDIAPVPGATRVLAELAPERHLRMDVGHDGRGADLLGSVTAIPLRDGSVDLLVCYHVLDHVPDDVAAMRELARVLAPGGIGLVQVATRSGGDDFEQRLLDAGLVFTRVSPRSLVGERVAQVLGLLPDERVWVVRSSVHADTEVAPLLVPPPTALVRALDAVVEAWSAELVRLSHSRRAQVLAERDSRPRTLGGRVRARVSRRRRQSA